MLAKSLSLADYLFNSLIGVGSLSSFVLKTTKTLASAWMGEYVSSSCIHCTVGDLVGSSLAIGFYIA